VTKRGVPPLQQPPNGLGRAQVQLACALHLSGIEFAGVGDDFRGRPGAFRRAHQYQIRYENAPHDARCHLPHLDAAAVGQGAFSYRI
jgi:hypothetical protein